MRPYNNLIRPNGGMKEVLPPGSKIKRNGIEYRFIRIIQEGLDRGKIEAVKEIDLSLPAAVEEFYPSEFGCEVVY